MATRPTSVQARWDGRVETRDSVRRRRPSWRITARHMISRQLLARNRASHRAKTSSEHPGAYLRRTPAGFLSTSIVGPGRWFRARAWRHRHGEQRVLTGEGYGGHPAPRDPPPACSGRSAAGVVDGAIYFGDGGSAVKKRLRDPILKRSHRSEGACPCDPRASYTSHVHVCVWWVQTAQHR